MVQAASPALFSIGTGEGNILPFLCPLDFVALAFHQKNEIIFTETFLHGISDIVHQPEFPALTLLRRPVFTGGHLLAAAFILGQDTESMRLTQLIADGAELLQGIGILAKLPPGLKVHRVDDKVRMYMIGITVGGDLNLVPGPGPCGKFHGNLMGLLGRDLFLGREGLDILIKGNAVHFAVDCLGSFKLQNGIPSVAVDTADEVLLRLRVPGLIPAHTVIHNGPHSTQVLAGFFDIGHGCHGTPRLIQ